MMIFILEISTDGYDGFFFCNRYGCRLSRLTGISKAVTERPEKACERQDKSPHAFAILDFLGAVWYYDNDFGREAGTMVINAVG